MKTLSISVLILSILFVQNSFATSPPIIAFSDLTSAPRSNWSSSKPDLGAAVTIWGKNFGTSKGDSFITLNNTKIDDSESFFSPWGATDSPVPMLQNITFQLNKGIPLGKGNLTITVNGKTSNSIEFNVTDKNIYFLDSGHTGSNMGTFDNPWTSFNSFRIAMTPGDIAYVKGNWTTKQTGGQVILYFSGADTPGTADEPIGIVGWPGESNLFQKTTNELLGCIAANNAFVTFSRLNLDCYTYSIYSTADGARIIGNKAQGPYGTPYGAGTIQVGNDYSSVFGNHLSGSITGSRYDHAIYVTGCMPEAGAKVAYNYITNHDVGEGPHIVVNHQDSRCTSDVYLKSHFIYSNYIDCTGFPSRAIGIYHQSWDGPPETEPETTYVYNNISVSCGIDRTWPAMQQNAAHVAWYNNTIYDSKGIGLIVGSSRPLTAIIKNNIFNISRDDREFLAITATGVEATIDNNLYYGGTKAPPTQDAHPLLLNPELIPDISKATMETSTTLKQTGAIDSITQTYVITDFYLEERSPVSLSVGAIELETVKPPFPPGNLRIK